MIEVRGWSDSRKGSQAKESRQPPDTKKKKIKERKENERNSPLEAPKGTSPVNSLALAQ